MHILDGFLDDSVAVAAAVPAIAAVGYGVHRAGRALDDRGVALVGVTGAFVFAAQMLNFPVAGGTSGHLLGGALAAVLVGPWLACLVMAVVISGQALAFADGGVAAIGANVLNMGVVGALATGALMLAARRVLPRTRATVLAVAGAGAWLSVMGGAALAAAELGVSGTVPFTTALPAMLGVHALIGVGEAAITVAAVAAVLATRPGLVGGAGSGAPVAAARGVPATEPAS
jgi:cobalt/nickel transport system permease protein